MLKLGVLGHPLGHTLSPRLHQLFLEAAGLSGTFEVFDVRPEDLSSAMAKFRLDGVRGLSVTIPHKQAVMPFCDQITPRAERIGAVNTLTFEGDQLIGDNTDAEGFARNLPVAVLERLPESQVLMLGGGGAARAILSALIDSGTAQIVVAVRSPEKGMALVADAEGMKEAAASSTELGVAVLAELGDLEAFSGVVNTTPVGMFPQVEDSPLSWAQLQSLPAGAWVSDIVYRPLQTQLLQDAARAGVDGVPGLGMLIYQGVTAFERWSGTTVSPETIVCAFAELEKELAVPV